MARGMNKVMVIGFVERKPEIRHTANRQPVAAFSVSTSRHLTTNSGEDRNATEWFNVVTWGDLAEAAVAQLQKDQRLYVEGYLQTRSWDDIRGQRHVRTEVVACKLIPMETREVIAARNADTLNDGCSLCLNRVMIIGNLGRNPEMRYTPDGQAVTSFSLAATRSWASGQGGRSDSTEWFNVVSWGSLAEICNQYLTKGRRVYVEGELRTRGWEQPDGNKRFRTELVANEMIMLGPRPNNWSTEQEPAKPKEEPPF
jgi:single-strand DNA-binding protein